MKGLLAGLLGLGHVAALVAKNASAIANSTSSQSNSTFSVLGLAAGCTTYTVTSTDTCLSIAYAKGVSFAQILSWNPQISITCSNLGSLVNTNICLSNPNGDYSLPSIVPNATATTVAPAPTHTADGTNAYCAEYYYVNWGEDCGTITTKFSITMKDFRFLNPDVDEECLNLLAEVYYCVRPVGSITTYPGYLTGRTSRPFTPSVATPLPWQDPPGPTLNKPLIPLANLTRRDCFDYIVFEDLTDNAAADCWSLALLYDVSPQDFIAWNPSLWQGETKPDYYGTLTPVIPATYTTNPFAYSCTLSTSSSYCVALASPTPVPVQNSTAPTPRAAGEIEGCTAWWQVKDYNTCNDPLALFGFKLATFYAMNPSIGPQCTGMAIGTYYCVSTSPDGYPPSDNDSGVTTPVTSRPITSTGTGILTPTPIQSGMITNCGKFYQVKDGDSCSTIVTANKINLKNFYLWNPDVGTTCTNLQPGTYVCVGLSSASATATPTPTSSVAVSVSASSTATKTTSQPGGLATPTPVQDGMVAGCKSFYKVLDGDSCSAIVKAAKINLKNFYAWNPAVGNTCINLQPGVYVCVGIS